MFDNSSSTTTLESENGELNIGIEINITAQKIIENTVVKNIIYDLGTFITGTVGQILSLS